MHVGATWDWRKCTSVLLLPEHDVREEAGLQVKPTPAQTLAVHREVLGYPEYRVRQSTTLGSTKLLVEASRWTVTRPQTRVEIRARNNKVSKVIRQKAASPRLVTPRGLYRLSNTWFLGSTWVSPQTASRSVQPFLHSSPVCPTHRPPTGVINYNSCAACRRCGLIT